jgi:hypothetical protein
MLVQQAPISTARLAHMHRFRGDVGGRDIVAPCSQVDAPTQKFSLCSYEGGGLRHHRGRHSANPNALILGFVAGAFLQALISGTHDPSAAIWGVIGGSLGAVVGFLGGGILAYLYVRDLRR